MSETKTAKYAKNCCRILFVIFLGWGTFFLSNQQISAQSPSPSPTPDEVDVNGYSVKSTVELGVRGKDVNGSENKYRSDFNYKSGFRVFNSSFMMERKEGTKGFFDTFLVNASGWGADPTSYARVNIDKTGAYSFTGNVRRFKYFNNLSNHALQEHTQNTQNNMGDFDLTVLPNNDKLKFNLGYSYVRYTGPGVWTARAYRDDFATSVSNSAISNDFRFGVQAKLAGFNLGFTEGYRRFNDKTRYFLTGTNLGNNTTDTTIFTNFTRNMPVKGEAWYSMFNVQRTFAKRLDFAADLIYSSTKTNSGVYDLFAGRDNSNNFVDSDTFQIQGDAKRPQTRGDIGLTYRVTDKLRISNTFTFDQFAVNGGETLYELLIRRNAAGTSLPNSITRSDAYRVDKFRRYKNTIEGDYQFNDRVSFHIGYRYTHRKVDVTGYDRTLTSAPSATNPLLISEEETNSTNTVLAGMRIKPVKNWVMFWDVERGSADNVFTRVENYKFTNFRFRNRLSFNQFVLNLSAISKDNTNPSGSSTVPPIAFDANVKSRIYSGSLDWNPITQLSMSGGYTYTHQTSHSAIIVPVSGVQRLGYSEYFVRDNYAFFDISAKPVNRVSIFASYRISKDRGQGDRPFSTLPQIIINSYPMQLQSPEVKASVRLTRNIDWNVGYQYLNYKDRFTPTQDYKAHLPYTSLTIYFGGADR